MISEPFRLDIAQSVVDDLRERLDGACWPSDLDRPGWEDGTSSALLRWPSGFAWRAQTAINRIAQPTRLSTASTVPRPRARSRASPLPLILTPGSPSTFYNWCCRRV